MGRRSKWGARYGCPDRCWASLVHYRFRPLHWPRGLAEINTVGGYPSNWSTDLCGHGTHVAGTINAVNNTLGVVGVSPGDVSLYILKVFGDDCSGVSSSDLVAAAHRCQNAGANVINMSLGGPFKSRTEQRAFQQLYDDGILPFAAAGNDGNCRKSYPASYDSVISVAAIDENNVVADFSQQNDKVELSAPGFSVLSTVPWIETNTLTVDGVNYEGNYIENAARVTSSGDLAIGGLCEQAGSWYGAVVLCERGNITFNEKVTNVEDGGGVTAIIYNNEPGNFFGTLGDGNSSNIPAISLSQEDGQELVFKLGFLGVVESTISKPDSGYEGWGGTSMATPPHVSGVAARVWSSDSLSLNTDIRDALQNSALDLGDPGKDNAYGYGLVQAFDAWQYLGGGSGSDSTPPPPVGSDDTPAPVISNVSSNTSGRGGNFKITWNTDEPADSEVKFTCCGVFTNSELVTDHSMGFRGQKGVTYEYWVSSTDAAGNKATEGPLYHPFSE